MFEIQEGKLSKINVWYCKSEIIFDLRNCHNALIIIEGLE